MSTFTSLNGGPEPQRTKAEKHDAQDDHHSIPRAATTQLTQDREHRESWPTQGIERTAASVPPISTMSPHHKRKRSSSEESCQMLEEAPKAQGAGRQQLDPTETRSTTNGVESRETHTAPVRDVKPQEGEHRERETWQHSDRTDRASYDAHANSGSTSQPNNHEGGGEARPSSRGAQSEYGNTSPDAEDRSVALYRSTYSLEQRNNNTNILQHDPKKRKRNFSNRTKTGCLTCRKRKKKCDEQKPECVNCIRGGFVCAGYPPQRGAGWPRMDNKIGAVPLESKGPNYVPNGAYGMPQSSTYAPPAAIKREPLPQYRGQTLRIDPPQGRNLATEDDRHATTSMSPMPKASTTNGDNKLAAVAYASAAAVLPTPVSANPPPQAAPVERTQQADYRRVPGVHELSRSGYEDAHNYNQLPRINVLQAPTTRNTPSPPQSSTPTTTSQNTAQMARSQSETLSQPRPSSQLQPLSTSQSPQFSQRRTQKEEMLAGGNYYPLDKELCLERERCSAACWRFNSLTLPLSHGVSTEERARLFRNILQPRENVPVSPDTASPVAKYGRVGNHVAVETPFTCDYGYNISIGNDVVIGRNCTINDVCEVRIGDNCILGPNVSIYTGTLSSDPKKRQGGRGPQYGKGVVIEQDCWIGGGATILYGRTIGKGSTVGAGSVVTKDVPPFTVVAGNPARVLRGVSTA